MTDAARQTAAIAAEARHGDAQRPDGPGRRPRVLVVDDHPQICHLVDAALRHAGFDVVPATAPGAALAVAAIASFDVVVSDVHMPGMSGPELYAALSALQPGLPVVFISAAASVADLPAGAPLIRKPFDFSELTAAVSRVLGASVPAPR